MLNRRLHRLVWVYTCQNGTLLEISCHSSYVIITEISCEMVHMMWVLISSVSFGDYQ